MSRTDPQFNLRIPVELRDKVMDAARNNKRSVTAEILDRLESSFPLNLDIEDLAIDKDEKIESLFGVIKVKKKELDEYHSTLSKLLFEEREELKKQLANAKINN